MPNQQLHFNEHSIAPFLALTTRQGRDEFLAAEPLWQQTDVHTRVNAQTLQAIVQHIADCQKYHSELIRAKNRSVGLMWAEPDHWRQWQKQIVCMRDQLDWTEIESLVNTIFTHQNRSVGEHNEKMLLCANEAMGNGIELTPQTLVFCSWTLLENHTNPRHALMQMPHILAAFNHPANANVFTSIAMRLPAVLQWMQYLVPEMNAWSLGEQCMNIESREKMANTVLDSALFKAWYGIALSLEEAQLHPLAHSLYVRKHTPVYLAEVEALPEHWQLAMELANTGLEFKCLLLQAQTSKPAENLPLPADIQ